jgi:glutathione peroxidase
MDRRSFLLATAGMMSVPALAQAPAVSQRTCYTIAFDKLDGGELRLSDFAGKPILIVNTASLCGFTPQYAGLQKLWDQYSEQGLMIIGVPSNDFGGQEPGGEHEIHATTNSYGVKFPMTAKVKVLGADAHPFYRWAAQQRPREVPKWNFHKYLVGRNGHVADVFGTVTDPASPNVMRAIEREFRSTLPG